MNNIFDTELSYIYDDRIRDSAKKLIGMLPDYFFHVPASSTGKYHPKCSNGEGGLVNHTKIAVRYAKELMDNKVLFNNIDRHDHDIVILALIMHDGFKHGLTQAKYVCFDHPLISANFVKDHAVEVGLTEEEGQLLYEIISSHMGYFNTSSYSDVVLPRPKTALQKFVHMCDDLASKKFINVEFENNNIVE